MGSKVGHKSPLITLCGVCVCVCVCVCVEGGGRRVLMKLPSGRERDRDLRRRNYKKVFKLESC